MNIEILPSFCKMMVPLWEMERFNTSEKMQLMICNKKKQVKVVVVTKNSNVSILDQLFMKELITPQYVHNNVILSKNVKFDAYNVKSEDCIFVFDDKERNTLDYDEIETIISLTKDRHNESDISVRARAAADNSFRREIQRLNDIKFNKRQLKRNFNYKLNIEEDKTTNTHQNKTQTIIPSSNFISNTPLPKFW
ncbi:hypothetical protein TVAG_306390 [Trichomonas vaginalis G3]|uniref:Uncharacterized protein n=1 Tax=Trichomonas vaginalis (strain ATCC PRA-98 / G3) TaxID=412133 RepID=A2DNC9_TRIV3|nr:hypothetical protein TVAGG3_1024540 [Trichomonas vaginalis G3]EAY18117.1 hypothetical protein TVAG_306390 [Trichomonas vaginalis G3]KAI5492394.1 hypothetical protein TVAGG3_1024540 [Trichomonas vaginalis G3]|eukprot:XP_001579103.1 hypothetical protein [Trichomonas vaginalis G3]